MSNRRSLSLHSRPGLLWAYLSSKLIGVVIQSPFKKLLKWQLYLFYAYSLDEPSGISYIGWQHLTTYCPLLEVHIEIQVRPPREILLQSCAVPKILPSWFTGCKPQWSHGDGFHSKGLLTQLGLGVWLPSIPCQSLSLFHTFSVKVEWHWAILRNLVIMWLASNLTDVTLAMKCEINGQKSKIFPNTKLNHFFGKLVATYNFASSLFCTAQSAFAVEICAQMGQIAGMAWKNSSGTLLLERLQLQLWQPYRWQIFHCMVAGIELEQYARINNEKGQIYPTNRACWEGRGVAITAKLIRAHPKPIPNPILECPLTMYQILRVCQAEKQSFPSTNLDRVGKTGGYLQLRSFTFLPAQTLLVSSSSCWCCRGWKLETSSPKLIILARSLLRTILDVILAQSPFL